MELKSITEFWLIVSGGDQAGELFKKLVVKLVIQTNDVQMKKTYGFSFSEYIKDRKGNSNSNSISAVNYPIQRHNLGRLYRPT